MTWNLYDWHFQFAMSMKLDFLGSVILLFETIKVKKIFVFGTAKRSIWRIQNLICSVIIFLVQSRAFMFWNIWLFLGVARHLRHEDNKTIAKNKELWTKQYSTIQRTQTHKTVHLATPRKTRFFRMHGPISWGFYILLVLYPMCVYVTK